MSGTDTVTLGHPAWLAPDRHVVVGVDGSQRNDAAVGWAEAEAEATGRPLELVMVLDDAVVPVPHHSLVEDDQRFRDLLDDLTGEIRAAHPKLVVHQAVELGSSVERLLHRSKDANCIVVGRRGLGAFGRALVGSTSIGVAGRSHVPTVIVPDEWDAIARTKSSTRPSAAASSWWSCTRSTFSRSWSGTRRWAPRCTRTGPCAAASCSRRPSRRTASSSARCGSAVSTGWATAVPG